jgi:uncharacterized protein (TIGR00730 family)
MFKRICVYCGSNPGNDPAYVTSARIMGRALAERGIELVYGGVGLGLMGAVADGVLEGGGQAIGIIPKDLLKMEIAHAGLTELHVVDNMHERKRLMAARADAFVALPGGSGTLDELFEIFTWAQLGFHAKPIGLLHVNGFYTPLLAMMDHLVETGFIKRVHADMLLTAATPDDLLDRMARYQAPNVSKWNHGH